MALELVCLGTASSRWLLPHFIIVLVGISRYFKAQSVFVLKCIEAFLSDIELEVFSWGLISGALVASIAIGPSLWIWANNATHSNSQQPPCISRVKQSSWEMTHFTIRQLLRMWTPGLLGTMSVGLLRPAQAALAHRLQWAAVCQEIHRVMASRHHQTVWNTLKHFMKFQTSCQGLACRSTASSWDKMFCICDDRCAGLAKRPSCRIWWLWIVLAWTCWIELNKDRLLKK